MVLFEVLCVQQVPVVSLSTSGSNPVCVVWRDHLRFPTLLPQCEKLNPPVSNQGCLVLELSEGINSFKENNLRHFSRGSQCQQVRTQERFQVFKNHKAGGCKVCHRCQTWTSDLVSSLRHYPPIEDLDLDIQSPEAGLYLNAVH